MQKVLLDTEDRLNNIGTSTLHKCRDLLLSQEQDLADKRRAMVLEAEKKPKK